MSQLLVTGLLSAHLLLVDLAMIGPLVCVWLDWRHQRRGDEAAGRTARRLVRHVNLALWSGALLGGLLLALRWVSGDERYFQALATVPHSRLWWAGAELVFSASCLAAYQLLWQRLQARRWLHRLLAIFASTNLMMHFPALFVIVSVLVKRGPSGNELDRAGFQNLLVDGEVVSRVVHVWLAALAVTAAAAMITAQRFARQQAEQQADQTLVRRIAWVALAAGLLQVPTGVWVAWQLPETARDGLLGGDMISTLLLLTSLAITIPLINTWAAVALGDRRPALPHRAAAMLTALVIAMVGTRQRVESLTTVAQTRSPHESLLNRGPLWQSGTPPTLRLAQHAELTVAEELDETRTTDD